MNGIKATVTGGNVQLSPDQKTLTLQLQLDGSTGTPMTTGGGVGGGVGGGAGGGAGGGVGGGAIGAAVGGAVVGVGGGMYTFFSKFAQFFFNLQLLCC